MQAQAPAPTPNPEVKKLRAYVGHWTFEAEVKPGPWGPGVKVSGTYGGKMTLGGFFFQGEAKDKGVLQDVDYFGYDAVSKNLVADSYYADGNRVSMVGSVSGNTFKWSGKATSAGGEQYSLRIQDNFAADFMSVQSTWERSPDGKTWVPYVEMKWAKAEVAPK
jgi:hypothetical protein